VEEELPNVKVLPDKAVKPSLSSKGLIELYFVGNENTVELFVNISLGDPG